MKTAEIILACEDPESWWSLIQQLGIEDDEEKCKRFFVQGDAATIKITVNENMQIIGGRILPVDWADADDEELDDWCRCTS